METCVWWVEGFGARVNTNREDRTEGMINVRKICKYHFNHFCHNFHHVSYSFEYDVMKVVSTENLAIVTKIT